MPEGSIAPPPAQVWGAAAVVIAATTDPNSPSSVLRSVSLHVHMRSHRQSLEGPPRAGQGGASYSIQPHSRALVSRVPSTPVALTPPLCGHRGHLGPVVMLGGGAAEPVL